MLTLVYESRHMTSVVSQKIKMVGFKKDSNKLKLCVTFVGNYPDMPDYHLVCTPLKKIGLGVGKKMFNQRKNLKLCNSLF